MAAAKKSGTYHTAFSAVICALCVSLMFLTGLFPFATYAIPAAAGMFLVAIFLESGPKYAYLIYIAVSILSVFLCADKEAALLFALFFGHYPITKAYLERIKNMVFQFALKLLVFNALVVAAYALIFSLFLTPELLEDFDVFGKYTHLLLLGLGNLVFLFYDIGLTRVITVYIKVIKPKYIDKLLRK